MRICSEFTIETSEYHPEYHYSDTILVANYEKAFHISDALNSAQKVKFSIKDFFSKCDQIPTHLLKKSLMENSIFVQFKPLQSSNIAISKEKVSAEIFTGYETS